jgi:hypothetical protein
MNRIAGTIEKLQIYNACNNYAMALSDTKWEVMGQYSTMLVLIYSYFAKKKVVHLHYFKCEMM